VCQHETTISSVLIAFRGTKSQNCNVCPVESANRLALRGFQVLKGAKKRTQAAASELHSPFASSSLCAPPPRHKAAAPVEIEPNLCRCGEPGTHPSVFPIPPPTHRAPSFRAFCERAGNHEPQPAQLPRSCWQGKDLPKGREGGDMPAKIVWLMSLFSDKSRIDRQREEREGGAMKLGMTLFMIATLSCVELTSPARLCGQTPRSTPSELKAPDGAGETVGGGAANTGASDVLYVLPDTSITSIIEPLREKGDRGGPPQALQCTPPGRACNPYANSCCSHGCVFHGGSTRVGYVCR
jgi:hypothetical protein